MGLKDILAAATPGPWTVSLTDDTVIIGPDRLEVAAIDGDYNRPETWPIMEANAALIALAPALAVEVLALRAKLAEAEAERDALMAELQSVLDACDQGRMVPRPGCGIGGMTIEANIRGSVYNNVPAWPIEEARAALATIRKVTA